VKIPINDEAPLDIAKTQKNLRPVRMKATHQRPNKYRFATANETATDKRTTYKSGGICLTRIRRKFAIKDEHFFVYLIPRTELRVDADSARVAYPPSRGFVVAGRATATIIRNGR